jgi:RNA polymerase sigma factor (sigma-70 family)
MKESTQQETYQTRATLLHRIIKERDEKSWDEFVLYYKDFIYLICCKMNLNHHDANDIVQQVLVKLWKKFPDFEYDETKRFRSWLCRIIQNTAIDFFRKVSSVNKLKENFKAEKWTAELPEIEDIADREWNDYLTTKALENIKPHFSEKSIEIFLKLARGIKAKELEKEYDLQPDVVYVYRKRIRDKLKDELRRIKQDLGC